MYQEGGSDPVGSQRKKIGLALGGGGARGLAHIGVLKVFDREHIPVDAIAGSSMGGIIGAFYAAGFPATRIESEILRISRSRREIVRLIDLRLNLRGLVGGERITELLSSLLGPAKTFADLRIPFVATAVDMRTGREVDLRDGSVVEAVRATMSVPIVFAPAEMPPYRLVDGGVLNNVPADAAFRLGVDAVIAVDVMPNFRANVPGDPPIVVPVRDPKLPEAVNEIWHVVMVMMAALTEYRLKATPPDLVIRPDLPADLDVLFGFERASEAIAAGERAAAARLNEIRLLLGV